MAERGPADQAVRETALAADRSFIVQAPAGSGKTEMLTRRFLRLLALVGRPEEIIAITFTRKAAGEMRDRILSALQLGAAAEPPAAAHQRRTWELARAALKQDRALGWQLAGNPRRLRIETIDALNAWLARQLPLSSRLGTAPAVADDPEPVYRATARGILLATGGTEPHARHAAAVLAHLGGRFNQAEDLLVALLKSRDHWLGKIVGERSAEPAAQRASFDAALRHLVADELRRAAESLPVGLLEEILPLCAAGAARVPDNELLAALADRRAVPQVSADELACWKALAEVLLVKSGAWRKRLDKNIGFPAGQSAAKSQMEAVLAQLTDTVDPEALHRIRSLPEPAYGDARWAILEHLLALLPICAAALNIAFAARGESDYVGIARAALDALGTPEDPTDLALALDGRISHLLVDEFQDTSQAQIELLERLTAGWTPGDGRTLFCVGDPMQSIYRFREADVGRFLRAQEVGIGGLPLEPLRLTVNFRSQGALVEWVSSVFPSIFPERADLALGAVPFAPSVAWHEPLPGAAVECLAVPRRNATAEAEAVVGCIGRIRRESPRASIAVLVRGRRHLDRITPALRAAGIPMQAVDIEPLAEGPAIRDLEALTRALCHRADRTAWLAVLRAPWCGVVLADLLALAGSDEDDLWSRMHDSAVLAQLSEEGRRRVGRLVATLAPALADRGRRALRRVVESAWLALGGPATLERASELADARRFLEFLDGRARHGDLDDPAALAGLLGELYAAPETAADAGVAVQLLTIHKAKGLEFDHVVLPGLDRGIGGEGKKLLRWLEQVRAEGTEILFAPIERLGEEHDELHQVLRKLEQRRNTLEQDRVLYVAATRARRRLHLVAGLEAGDADAELAPQPPKGSPLARLWDSLEEAFLAAGPVGVPPPTAPACRPAAVLRRLAADWQAPVLPAGPSWTAGESQPAPPGAHVEYDWAGREARAIGVAVHRMLQIMATEGAKAWTPGRLRRASVLVETLLKEAGLGAAELEGAVSGSLSALARTLADERGRWLLDPSHPQSATERRVSGRLEGRLVEGVVDRCFVDGAGALWIVDYKAGRHEGGRLEDFLDREQARYRPQLERYARLLGPLHSGPVRLGLYFPQHAAWCAWDAPG
jgi:ATP-dependent exoDNAse (exonuclease V) beta subunit